MRRSTAGAAMQIRLVGALDEISPRFLRRASLRGVVAGGSALTAGALVPRPRRPHGFLPAAVAGAILVGAAEELPAAGVPAAAVAAGLLARARPSARAAVTGLGLGAGVAVCLRRAWPVPPRTAAEVRRTHSHIQSQPEPDGDGVAVVVNATAGANGHDAISERLRERLPGATVIEVPDGGDLGAALARAAQADVIGIAGGDGSLNAGAGAAREAGKPLLVIPAGTLNHFVRDLGVDDVDDALDALRDGHAVAVDTGTIDGHPFLNTASFGTYGDLVDARERLEGAIGKWPALVLALAGLLRSAAPMDVELDGRRRRLWMVFVGNCTYSPAGFAPAWRERLDDGWLDVRLVDASRPFARARLLLAVLTGRLAKTVVYEAFRTRDLHVRSLGEPLRLARDGEVFDGHRDFTIEKGPSLAVYAPPAPPS